MKEQQEQLDIYDGRAHWIILSIISIFTTIAGTLTLYNVPERRTVTEMLFLSVFVIGGIYGVRKSLKPTIRFTMFRNGILFYPSFFISYERIRKLHYEYRSSGKTRTMYLIFTYESGTKNAEHSLPTTFLSIPDETNELLKSLGGEHPRKEIAELTKTKDPNELL